MTKALILADRCGDAPQFFPLFFKNDCGLSPIGVQCVYVAMPLLMAGMSGVGTAVSKRLGRVQTMVGLKVVGVSLLVAMALLKSWVNPDGDDFGSGEESPQTPRNTGRVVVMVIIYLVRTGLMNCTCERVYRCKSQTGDSRVTGVTACNRCNSQ